jgi:hypothetical protein
LLSATLACLLFIGPQSLLRAFDNATFLLGSRPLFKLATRGIEQRDERCTFAHSAFPPGADKEECNAAASTSRVPISSNDGIPLHAGVQATSTSNLATEEYKTVTSEIKDRLSNENLLFALKFTVIGGILWLLFSVFGKREHDFGRFAHDRRAALFVVAALLSCAVVDTRLRFNSKVVESLGDWVWCYEKNPASAFSGDSSTVMWEHFLHLQLSAGPFPILRHVCHLLTPLLYAISLYLFIMTARTMHRSTVMMIVKSAAAFFALAWLIACSHDSLWGIRWLDLGLPTLLAVVGWILLWKAYRHRFTTANVLTQTREYVQGLTDEKKMEALEDMIAFGVVHRPRDIITMIAKGEIPARMASEMINKHLNLMILNWPESVSDRPQDRETPDEIRVRKLLQMNVKDRHRFAADLAEERLWRILFLSRSAYRRGGRRFEDELRQGDPRPETP